MIEAPTGEFLAIAAVVGLSTWLAIYMAARTAPQISNVEEEAAMADNGQITFDEWRLSDEQARARRDAMLAEVAENNSGWLALAAAEMRRLDAGTEGIGEDFRVLLRGRGVPDPKHPNAHGAFINAMVRRGVLVPTGEYRPMRGAKANARRSPVYRLLHSEAA